MLNSGLLASLERRLDGKRVRRHVEQEAGSQQWVALNQLLPASLQPLHAHGLSRDFPQGADLIVFRILGLTHQDTLLHRRAGVDTGYLLLREPVLSQILKRRGLITLEGFHGLKSLRGSTGAIPLISVLLVLHLVGDLGDCLAAQNVLDSHGQLCLACGVDKLHGLNRVTTKPDESIMDTKLLTIELQDLAVHPMNSSFHVRFGCDNFDGGKVVAVDLSAGQTANNPSQDVVLGLPGSGYGKNTKGKIGIGHHVVRERLGDFGAELGNLRPELLG